MLRYFKNHLRQYCMILKLHFEILLFIAKSNSIFVSIHLRHKISLKPPSRSLIGRLIQNQEIWCVVMRISIDSQKINFI